MAKFITPGSVGPTGPQGPSGNGISTDTYDKLYVTNNGAGTNVKIGDDAWIGDVNLGNTISIKGVEDATKGGIVFGNGLSEKIQTDGTNLSLIAENDIILNAGSSYAYLGTPTVGGETRLAQRGFFSEVDRDILPASDNAYTLGNSEYRWKSISIGEGTIYITDATTGDQVALTINNGVFFIDGIAQAQLPAIIANNIELHDGNDNVVLRLVEESGTGKLYFGGGSNGIWQDSGKTYITGISYRPEDAGRKPMFYNSSTGEVSYNSDAPDAVDYTSLTNKPDLSVYQQKIAGISDTEIGYLDGVTSAIQTQIDAKVTSSSPTITTPTIATINAGGATATPSLFPDVTSGTVTIAGGKTSGAINIAGATGFSGTVNIANGTSAKTINIANGTSSGTNTINIGSNSGTTNTALYGNVYLKNLSAPLQTDSVNLFSNTTGTVSINNSSANNGITNLVAGAITTGLTKTINLGTAGLTGSTTNITVGTSSGGTSNITLNGNVTSGAINSATIGDSGWISVSSFDNGYSGTSVAYRKINNVVYLRGHISGGTAETSAFTLPSGYRPTVVDSVILTQEYGTPLATYITAKTDGTVVPHTGSSWLSGVVFPA